jgi:hypothetical protein
MGRFSSGTLRVNRNLHLQICCLILLLLCFKNLCSILKIVFSCLKNVMLVCTFLYLLEGNFYCFPASWTQCVILNPLSFREVNYYNINGLAVLPRLSSGTTMRSFIDIINIREIISHYALCIALWLQVSVNIKASGAFETIYFSTHVLTCTIVLLLKT